LTATKPLVALLRAAALLVTTLATAAPAIGSERAVLGMLSIDDADAPGRCPVMGLLAVPGAWRFGDAAAVVMAPSPGGSHARLIVGLLSETTAVLEIADAERCGAEAALLAKTALAEAIGPGAMVAIGFGSAGKLALHAGENAFLARIAVNASAVSIAPGPTPRPEEQIGRRWPRFCAVLAASAPIDAATCNAALPTAPALLAGAPR